MKLSISLILFLIFSKNIFSFSQANSQGNLIVIPSGEVLASWISPLNPKFTLQQVSSQKSKKDKRENKNKNESIKKVKVKSFRIMPKAVTIKEFKYFLEKNPQWKKENISKLYADESYLELLSDELKIKEEAPMTAVSWYAARAYCENFGMRLPTTLEWEYVGAASEKIADANKDETFLKRILEWYGEPRTNNFKPVGSIYKNLYGVWDMHGLVWEWVEDFNSTFVTGESREDSSLNKNMFCGASALSGADKENYASFMRFAFRSALKGTSSVWNLGFRCAKDL